ncbi:hypothetical protein ABT052_29260 [Streptomyces sp. NPDC002766]|uniref:hypothetical protein n=1 Tax=Streptomyces sp. NPDC002766 TaxID=3154429 RepID=UPI00332F35CB
MPASSDILAALPATLSGTALSALALRHLFPPDSGGLPGLLRAWSQFLNDRLLRQAAARDLDPRTALQHLRPASTAGAVPDQPSPDTSPDPLSTPAAADLPP